MNAPHDLLQRAAGTLPRYECLLCNEPPVPTSDDVDACACGNLVVEPATGRVIAAAAGTLLDRDAALAA